MPQNLYLIENDRVLAETEGENVSHPLLNKLKDFRRQPLLCGTVGGTVWTTSQALGNTGF